MKDDPWTVNMRGHSLAWCLDRVCLSYPRNKVWNCSKYAQIYQLDCLAMMCMWRSLHLGWHFSPYNHLFGNTHSRFLLHSHFGIIVFCSVLWGGCGQLMKVLRSWGMWRCFPNASSEEGERHEMWNVTIKITTYSFLQRTWKSSDIIILCTKRLSLLDKPDRCCQLVHVNHLIGRFSVCIIAGNLSSTTTAQKSNNASTGPVKPALPKVRIVILV